MSSDVPQLDMQPFATSLRGIADAFLEFGRAIRLAVDSLSPEARASLEAATPHPYATYSCNCLCPARHPGKAVCQGRVEYLDLHPVRFGEAEVGMCPRCAGVRTW